MIAITKKVVTKKYVIKNSTKESRPREKRHCNNEKYYI